MGKTVLGVNDIQTWCKNHGEQGERILQEWTGKNENGYYININKVSYGSHKKVFWECKDCGYKWKTQVVYRTSGNNCPQCAGKVVYDKNSLVEWCNNHEEQGKRILQEWTGIDEYGNQVDINKISYGSNKRLIWKCRDCGYEWKAIVVSRTISNNNCPQCAKKIISIKKSIPTQGKNDLFTWCNNHGEQGERLLQEWTGKDENENPIDINIISYGSRKKVQWKCKKCENKWMAQVASRITGRGCPQCANHYGTSYPEQFIYQALKQIFPAAENRYKALKNIYSHGIEFDIAIPVEIDGYKAVCIEFSPTYWHKGKEERDQLKKEICQQYNIRFIEVIEDSYNEYQETWTPNYICFHMNYNQQEEELIILISYILNSLHHSINKIDWDKVKEEAWKYSHGEKL